MAVSLLDQRVAVVTGVGHGLRRKTARSLTGRGTHVVRTGLNKGLHT
jgi:NAD(P)-dependent dehydrogenase (short-subunit alcohol dehydrogenase family)